jgi:hypothetical protein
MVNIYILELEDGKFYVGKTDHTFQRFNQHWQGLGAKWTQKHKPVDLYAFHKDRTDSDENKFTLAMMRNFGVTNVRGGSWTKVEMSQGEIRRLEARLHKTRRRKKELSTSCARCGRTSHNITTCYARSHANGKPLDRRPVKTQDFQPFLESYKIEREEAILNDDDTDDEKQLASLLSEIDELLKMQEDEPEQFIQVMEGFSEDDDAPPYQDVLSGVIYNLRKVMEDTASEIIDGVVEGATKTAKQVQSKAKKSVKKAKAKGKKAVKRTKERFGL